MINGRLKKPLKVWLKSQPYNLTVGLLIRAEWDDALKWWNVYFLNGTQHLQCTTTEWPEV